MFQSLLASLVMASSGTAVRAEAPTPDPAVWRVSGARNVLLDMGLVLARPTALATGLATGVGGGLTFGRVLLWGMRGSWSTATESSLEWTITHSEYKMRAFGAIEHSAGRGRLVLRVAAGPTMVHETRLRNQGIRAGLTGDSLRTSSISTVPTADLELVIVVQIAGPWLMMVSGGPTISVLENTVRGGFVAFLGTGWHL